MKVLTIRLDDLLHSQLSVVAKLEGASVADAIREAINSWIEQRRGCPTFAMRAREQLKAIEEEAASQKDALTALLSEESPANTAATPG